MAVASPASSSPAAFRPVSRAFRSVKVTAPIPHSAATFRSGVCTTAASSAAPNDTARRSFPTGR